MSIIACGLFFFFLNVLKVIFKFYFPRIDLDDYTWNPEMESGSESGSESDSSDEDGSQESYSDVCEPEYADANICVRYVLLYIFTSLIALG